MKIPSYCALFFIATLSTASFAEGNNIVPNLINNQVQTEPDNRINLVLNKQERAIILSEMRKFLLGLQQMMMALATDDMKTVSEVATTLGPMMMRDVSKTSLRKKLPKEFKMLGHSTHNDFDLIAQNAKDLGDSRLILTQLGATLKKCVACHAAYQVSNQ